MLMLNVKKSLLLCEMLYGSSVVLFPSLSKTQMWAFLSTPILFFGSNSVHFWDENYCKILASLDLPKNLQ